MSGTSELLIKQLQYGIIAQYTASFPHTQYTTHTHATHLL